MSWNERLKEARENAGITKSELAKRAGVSAPTVTDWESGEIKKIDGENLLRVCGVVGVPPEWLIFGSADRQATDEAAAVASAFMRIKDSAQREAIITQLRAFGVLGK
jgi:transcriptional regulator with XRE-family HTH domain